MGHSIGADRNVVNVLVCKDGRTGSARGMQLWLVETKNIGWLGKSKQELYANTRLFRGYIMNRDWACKSQKVVLESADYQQFCWNDIRGNIISGDLGLNVGASDTLDLGHNEVLEERDVMSWLLLMQSWTVDELEVDMVEDAFIKAELSTENEDLKTLVNELRNEKKKMEEDKTDQEIWWLSIFNKDIRNKIKSTRHHVGLLKVSVRVPRWFVDKYFLNYNGQKMYPDEEPIVIVHKSENVWTTDDLPVHGIGFIPKSYFVQVWNGGQSYTYWHSQYGLYMDFRAPNLTYNRTTEKLTFTATKICATPSNYEQGAWQRYQ